MRAEFTEYPSPDLGVQTSFRFRQPYHLQQYSQQQAFFAEEQRRRDERIADSVAYLENKRLQAIAEAEQKMLDEFNYSNRMSPRWTLEQLHEAQKLCGDLPTVLQSRREQSRTQQMDSYGWTMAIHPDDAMDGSYAEKEVWELPWSREPRLQDYGESPVHGNGNSRRVQIQVNPRAPGLHSRSYW